MLHLQGFLCAFSFHPNPWSAQYFISLSILIPHIVYLICLFARTSHVLGKPIIFSIGLGITNNVQTKESWKQYQTWEGDFYGEVFVINQRLRLVGI
jgi:hypothetical protein